VRREEGIRVLRGPRSRSERMLGRRRPGRFRALRRIRRVVALWGGRWRVLWA